MTESQERAGSDDRRTGGDATVGTGPGAGAVRAAPAGTGDDGAAPSGTSADVRAAPVPPAPAFAPDSLVLNRKLPLWYQVSQSLRASILGRPRDASARLPTEEQLAAHYGVSVLTMRQALKELEAEGLISRHRRRGTFIEPRARRVSPSGCWARSTRSWPSSPARRRPFWATARQRCPVIWPSSSRAAPR